MGLAVSWGAARKALRLCLVAALAAAALPARAQNKRSSWEIFIYFGGYFANDVPAARQFGEITTTRAEPFAAFDPNDVDSYFIRNLGNVGGHSLTIDPSVYPFQELPSSQFFGNTPCNNSGRPPDDPSNPRPGIIPYFDECDNDQEARWRYNAGGRPIDTNGEIQRDDSEFALGIRAGYNFTRHWEIELDLGFGKQRLDLTQNLIPLLADPIDLSDSRAAQLAKFYEFTWANVDYQSLLSTTGLGELPRVVASRPATDPNYTIPIYFPSNVGSPGTPVSAPETFDDVTDFVNRVFLDPTAFRNRGNQVNIDQFTVSVSGKYNFNTKADSRIVPYVGAGLGRWIRNFDSPWDGNDTSFALGEAGVRLFVNEIFAFRLEGRYVQYLDDSFTIDAELNRFNLPDRTWDNFTEASCARDNRERRPPCRTSDNVPVEWEFPDLGGGGGNARISVEADLDDFYELRVGFDVVLGGK